MPSLPSLPEPNGPYTVGATTFIRSIPKDQQEVIGTACVRTAGSSHTTTSEDGLRPALLLEEVAFTVYYPADVSKHSRSSWLGSSGKHAKGMSWFLDPVAETLKGYEHFSGTSFPGGPGSWAASFIRIILSWYGSTVKIPVYENAPLLALESSKGSGWPLVMFSHGLGGTRTTYSVLCSHLAAQGRVVIAMEHRDGTGPAVFPGGRTMQYLVPDEAVWQGEKVTPDWQRGAYNSEKALRLRSDQLAFRRAEVYEALRCLKDLSSQGKEASDLEAFGAKDFDYAKWLHHISSDEVDLVGHSFGGATVFSILSHPPPTRIGSHDLHPSIPVRQTLVLDPWMEAFPGPGPSPYSSDPKSDDVAHPRTENQLLVLNSEYFTLWKSHFISLRKAVARFHPSRVLTMVGAEHTTFSDVPALVPRRFQKTDGRKMLETICHISDTFLKREMSMEGDLTLEGVKSRDADPANDKKKLEGEPGDLIIHK